MTEKEIIERAKKRVEDKKGFYSHLITYGIIITFLFLLNLFTSPDVWWFFYPAGGWGIGIAFHYFAVFGIMSKTPGDWEEKELEKEINRLKRSRKIDPQEKDTLDLNEKRKELRELREDRIDWDDRDLV